MYPLIYSTPMSKMTHEKKQTLPDSVVMDWQLVVLDNLVKNPPTVENRKEQDI